MVIACPTFKGQDSGSDLCEAYVPSTTLNHPRKGCVQVVATHGEVVGSEEDSAASLNRAGRYTRGVVSADIQIPVPESLQTRGAACRVLLEKNETAPASVRATVGDQCAIAGSGGVVEDRLATERAADRAAVIAEVAIACGRAVLEENEAWGYAAHCGTARAESAITRSRGVLKGGDTAAVERA